MADDNKLSSIDADAKKQRGEADFVRGIRYLTACAWL